MNKEDFLKFHPWPRNTGEFRYAQMYFEIPLPVTRAEIWPYLSDTSRMNRALNLGRRFEREVNGVLHVKEKMRGINLEWIEHPWVWLFESYATAEREYTRGPFRYFRCVFHISENPGGGITLAVQFAWLLKSRALGFLLRLAGRRFGRRLNSVLQNVALAIREKRAEANPYLVCTPVTDPAITRRLEEIHQQLNSEALDPGVVRTLVNYVKCGDSIDLHRLRPLKLAREWNFGEQELLRACLAATKAGLLTLSWEITCPHCRGVREETGSLSGIPKQGRCDVCDIDFSTQGENAVEVSFRVHESIRPAEKITYCSAEPAKKAHIKWQQTLTPGQKISALFNLPAGKYRLREITTKNKCLLNVGREGGSEFSWDISSPQEQEISMKGSCGLTVRNNSLRGASFVLEELWWEKDCLHPGRIFCVPEFQQLFSRDALTTGVQLDLGNQTILFSDIVGSTRFYREVGDSAAFAAVVEHFETLTAIIRRHGGAVIKTIGDSVMAAFHTPEHCLNACEEAQLVFSGAQSRQKVRLRFSVHHGPVIAVNWNTGKDYFGNVVNFAAKMQACAGAGEIAVSEELLALARKNGLSKNYPSRIRELEVAGCPTAAKVRVFDLNPVARLRLTG